MNTRIRIIPWVMLVVGFILLSAGVAELYPLCRAARNCHHTVGIVQRVETKKSYRHRKPRYDLWWVFFPKTIKNNINDD